MYRYPVSARTRAFERGSVGQFKGTAFWSAIKDSEMAIRMELSKQRGAFVLPGTKKMQRFKHQPFSQLDEIPLDDVAVFELALTHRPSKFYGDIDKWDTKQLSVEQLVGHLQSYFVRFWNQHPSLKRLPITKEHILYVTREDPNSKASLHFIIDQRCFHVVQLSSIAGDFREWLRSQPRNYFTTCMSTGDKIFDQKVYRQNANLRVPGSCKLTDSLSLDSGSRLLPQSSSVDILNYFVSYIENSSLVDFEPVSVEGKKNLRKAQLNMLSQTVVGQQIDSKYRRVVQELLAPEQI